MIRICGPKHKAPAGARYVNVTSRSKDWGKDFSPFFLGPVPIGHAYGARGCIAQRFENAWQYAKVYKQHVGPDGSPNEDYWNWAMAGWSKDRADRYPMGKGAAPEYSWWEGQKLTYIEARKKIYIPLYAALVLAHPSMQTLVAARDEAEASRQSLWLWDFDGYDHVATQMNLEEVANHPGKKMGHAFVLAMLLDCNVGTTMGTVNRIIGA